jgi:hypothetical protein
VSPGGLDLTAVDPARRTVKVFAIKDNRGGLPSEKEPIDDE